MKTIPVKDMYVIAYLLVKGEKYHHITPETVGQKRVIFFHFHEDVQEVIDDFFNNGECSAIAYKDSVANVRNLIYNYGR